MKPAALLLFFISSLGFARELTDATKTAVTLVDHPNRIVTLAPSLGELVSDLLGDELNRIVGVSEVSDYPPALEKIASIGPYAHFSLEKVISLKPDLVLATMDGNSKDQIQRLRELKVPVVVVETGTFQQVASSMRLVGQSLGLEKEGGQLAAQFETGLARIAARGLKRQQSGKVKRILFQLGDHPLIVVGGKSFLNEAITTVGAKNIYADFDSHYPRPSTEDAVVKNPDFILVLAFGKNLKPFQETAEHWEQYKRMKAVQTKQIQIMPGDMILRPTLRLLEGLSRLEKVIYGSE